MKFIVGPSIVFSDTDVICIIDVDEFEKINRPLFSDFTYAKSSKRFTLRKPKYSKCTLTCKTKSLKEVLEYLKKVPFNTLSIFNYQLSQLYPFAEVLEKRGKEVFIYSTDPSPSNLVFEGEEEDPNKLFSHFPKDEWSEFLNSVYPVSSVRDEINKIEELYEGEINEECEIYPPIEKTFTAFKMTPLDKIRVILIGQDPYHGDGEAMGLAFSVPKGVRIPPSLRNIFKELELEGVEGNTKDGDLTYLAEQGVFLINTALTVRAHAAGSHSKWWKQFTEYLMIYLSKKLDNVVYILLGSHAQNFKPIIETNSTNIVLETSHPSPLSVNKGFLGSNIFLRCNEYLKEPIKWLK